MTNIKKLKSSFRNLKLFKIIEFHIQTSIITKSVGYGITAFSLRITGKSSLMMPAVSTRGTI